MESIMNRRRVLVIDDDTVVRRMIAKLLKDRGVDTELAATGEEGLSGLETSALPDAVICDLYLPGISGLDVIEQIRRREEWRQLPIVVLTGRARGTMMVRAEELGDRIVTKPFSSVDLLQVIDDLLGKEDRAAS
jgi:CheY-like chemotaxis protein